MKESRHVGQCHGIYRSVERAALELSIVVQNSLALRIFSAIQPGGNAPAENGAETPSISRLKQSFS